jgi:hypothetical protein
MIDTGFHPDMVPSLSFMLVVHSNKLNHSHYVETLYQKTKDSDVFTPFFDKYHKVAQTIDICKPEWYTSTHWKFMQAKFIRLQQESQAQSIENTAT